MTRTEVSCKGPISDFGKCISCQSQIELPHSETGYSPAHKTQH